MDKRGLRGYVPRMVLICLFILITIFIVKAVPSSVTLDTPIQDEVISGTAYNFSATVDGTSTTNITFWYSSNSGTTWTPFTSVTNDTADQTSFSTTFNTITIADADNYIFNATADDILAGGTTTVSDNSTGVDVDNAAPAFSVLNITDGTTTLTNDTDLQGNNFTKDADITIRVTVTETRPDAILLYVNLTDGAISTSNYDNLTNMTTTDTSSPFMYNASILASDISNQDNVSFLIVGNDTEGNEYVLNYTATGQGFNFVVDAVTPIIWETLDNFEPVNYGNFSTLGGTSNALAINVSANETNTGSRMSVYACLSNSTGCVGGEVALTNETCDANGVTSTCFWSNSSLDTRNVADGIYNITFNATDLVENANATDASFTKGLNILVDNTNPVFSFINISDGNTTRINGTSLNNTFKIDNTQDITIRTTIADGNIDSLYLYYVCNGTNATTSNYYETVKMSTDETVAARDSPLTTSYQYNGTISNVCLEDGNETTFIIIGNDTANNEFQINDTSISDETLFTIVPNSTLVKVANVNVTDDSYTRDLLDGTKYLRAKLNTFNIDLQGEDKDGVLLYYNTTGSMSTAVDGVINNFDDNLVMGNLSGASSSGNSEIVFNTTVDLTGNDTNTIEFYIVANDTSGYVIIRGPYTYKIDGATPSTPTLTVPSLTIIGPADPIEYSCESSDGGSGISDWTWTLEKPNGDTITKTDTSVTKSTKTFSGTSETGPNGNYAIKCKATDNLGQTSQEVSSTFKVLATAGTSPGVGVGSGGVGSGGSAEQAISFDVDFTAAKSAIFKATQGRIKSFSFDGATKHTITFEEITSKKATLLIASNPIKISLFIGESKNIDLNNDGIDDLKIELNAITNGVADIKLTKLEKGAEIIAKEESPLKGVSSEGEKIEEEETASKKSNKRWWLALLLIIVVVIIGYYKNKNRFKPPSFGFPNSNSFLKENLMKLKEKIKI